MVGGYNRSLDQQGEVALARALAAGESQAFERFVEHFRSKIFHYSWLMCGQPDDAEEVAQEVLLKVFQNFGQLREPEHVRAWIFRIAKNACLIKRRKSDLAPASEITDTARLPDEELNRGGKCALCFTRSSPNYRRPTARLWCCATSS